MNTPSIVHASVKSSLLLLLLLICPGCSRNDSPPAFVVGYEQTDTVPLSLLLTQTNLTAHIEEIQVIQKEPALRVLVTLSNAPGRKIEYYDNPSAERLAVLHRLKDQGTNLSVEALRNLPP